MRNPAISILLIVKNALPILAGSLESLKNQTCQDFEVVVVDGASTDGTLDVLRQAANDLPLHIVSEPDRSLADGFAKGLRRASGGIVGMLCADERYYPDALERVMQWFAAEPDAAMCGGKVDFIDERDAVIGSDLTAPFNLPAHLACELVPSNLSSFFNRALIGQDFYFDADVPTCPDYEYWARLGFRFPRSAFRRYDVSVAQAYRTRDSMSFRAESFSQFCRDKLSHLNNLLAKGYVKTDMEAVHRRASAGIHMWAAEQLNSIEPGHPNILAHCAEAAHYDKSYERIARFVDSVGHARYDPATGIVRRNVLGPRAAAVAEFDWSNPPRYWHGATILTESPLTVKTARAPWGYSLQLSRSNENSAPAHLNDGQYWVRLDLEVVEGSVGVSMYTPNQELAGEQIFRKTDGRAVALIPLTTDRDLTRSILVRSGGQPSSVMRLHRAELLYDPDGDSGAVAAIDLEQEAAPRLSAVQ